MSFGYIDKSAYDTDDSHRLVINQTCFSDAIVFSYWNKLFLSLIFAYHTPLTWEKQMKKANS